MHWYRIIVELRVRVRVRVRVKFRVIIERNGHDVIHISFLYRVCACTTVEEITYSTGIPAAMARVTSAE